MFGSGRSAAAASSAGRLSSSRVLASGRRHQLHQPVGIGARLDVGDERRLLRDERRHEYGSRPLRRGVLAGSAPSSRAGKSPQHFARQVFAAGGQVLRIRALHRVDARARRSPRWLVRSRRSSPGRRRVAPRPSAHTAARSARHRTARRRAAPGRPPRSAAAAQHRRRPRLSGRGPRPVERPRRPSSRFSASRP